MSSVNSSFTGLKTHKSNRSDPDDTYKGSPCLYKAHGDEDGGFTWRDSETHGCLECCQDILSLEFSLDISKLNKGAQKKAYSFWSNVDIGGIDDCWRWQGRLIANSLYFTWERREIRNLFRFHPLQVAIWLSWGDTARLGTTSICGNRRCCNPLHNIPKGLIEKTDLESLDLEKAENQIRLLQKQLIDSHKNEHQDTLCHDNAEDEIQINKQRTLDKESFVNKIFEAQKQLITPRVF